MHILLGLLILAVVLWLILNTKQNHSEQSDLNDSEIDSPNTTPPFVAYLSKGKLFLQKPNEAIEQIHSDYIQNVIDRDEQSKQLHGWKENTSWGTAFAGNKGPKEFKDSVSIEFVSADFDHHSNKLYYFLRDDSFGGFFQYDLNEKKEQRLLHKQNLSFQDLSYNASNNKFLCSSRYDNGISNIVMMASDGSSYSEITTGDSFDTAPYWVNDKQVVYQSQGHARSTQGYVMAYGPSSIQLLDMESAEITPVLENPDFDFLQPQVCSQGNLYFIQRPFKMPKYDNSQALLDILLFPFRLLRAIFHYLNFFSLIYSNKPLTTAAGPQQQVDAKEIILQGKRINAEKALQKEKGVIGVPSLVPSSWKLICRNKQGQETVLCTNVSSFKIGDNDEIIYSNGCGIFLLQPGKKPSLVLKDNVIEEVIV